MWMVGMTGVSAQQATQNATPVKVAEEKPTMAQVKQGNQALNQQKPPRANSSASTPAKPWISPLGTVVSQPAEQQPKSQEAIVVLTKEQAAQARKMEEEKAAKQRAEKEANAQVIPQGQAAQAKRMEEQKRQAKELAQKEQGLAKSPVQPLDNQSKVSNEIEGNSSHEGVSTSASNPQQKVLISSFDFDRMSSKDQEEILSHPEKYEVIDKSKPTNQE